MKTEMINRALDLLKEEYPDAGCELNHNNPFELLVATMLSAQTTDKRVNMTTPALFEKYPDAFSLAKASSADIQEIIKSIGLYRNKTKNLLAMSSKLVEEYDGVVPGNYDELVKLPGVGRKTANVVLADGFGEQRIAVDTHVFRLANRIGFTHEKDVLKTELGLMEVLPHDRWTEAHHLIIFHGRRCCTARNPECDRCCISEICENRG